MPTQDPSNLRIELPGGLDVALGELLDISSDWFWAMDSQLRYTFFSDRVEEVTGDPAEWHIGKTRQELGLAVAEGDDPILNRETYQGRLYYRKTRAGRDLWIRSAAKPIFDEQNRFKGYIGTGTDVTAEIVAGKGVEEQRNLLISALESMSEGVALFDPEERLVYCNTAFTDLNPSLASDIQIGMTFEAMVRSNLDNQRILAAIGREEAFLAERLATFRDPDSEPSESTRADGRVLLLVERRLKDGSTFLINQDLTETRRNEAILNAAREEAERANRAKSEFLSLMSHELRTPLNAISGFSQILVNEVFGPHSNTKYREYAKDIHDSGAHLIAIVNDILDLSRIEAGEFEIHPTEFNLHDALEDCIKLVAAKQNRPAENFSLIGCDEGLSITADPRLFKQIVLNILANADRFTPADGNIQIEVDSQPDNALHIRIIDTGVGIDASDMDRVFEPFGQARTNVNVTHDGTGLGLPLSRKMMELHDGFLALDSTPGEGTTVTLYFPEGSLV